MELSAVLVSASGKFAADGVLGAADMLIDVVYVEGAMGGGSRHFAVRCGVEVIVGFRRRS